MLSTVQHEFDVTFPAEKRQWQMPRTLPTLIRLFRRWTDAR
jgi:hypothetical protein